eukprot:7504578-Lingulodinium_polyedra.AAC.1
MFRLAARPPRPDAKSVIKCVFGCFVWSPLTARAVCAPANLSVGNSPAPLLRCVAPPPWPATVCAAVPSG